ncbi:ferrochelatase [Sulfurimonas sp. HSL-1716]|uniref:ferrochelatase n=1 Tax=Hydrocurvibacter sulfurireducens TaxID=3131937 RepID=UPI0031FA16E6
MKKDVIILLNMGGPNNLDEVELFLKNMFNDPNILTMKSALLRRFVASMITFFRTESSKEIYKTLGGKSPIVDLTKNIVKKLQDMLKEGVIVDFVMRYTPPFADEVIQTLKEHEISKVYLIPMYPQYSTTTTKSSVEDFLDAFAKSGIKAETVYVKEYYDNKSYNEAVLSRIKESVGDKRYEDYDIVFSAHGLPQKIIDAGDVYQEHVIKNVDILKEMMTKSGMDFKGVHLAYQSKVGPMKWLEPSLGEMLKTLKERNVVIYPIAFTVDNSETDYELAMEYKEIAHDLGIKDYRVCRCVNDHELFVKALAEIYGKMKKE